MGNRHPVVEEWVASLWWMANMRAACIATPTVWGSQRPCEKCGLETSRRIHLGAVDGAANSKSMKESQRRCRHKVSAGNGSSTTTPLTRRCCRRDAQLSLVVPEARRSAASWSRCPHGAAFLDAGLALRKVPRCGAVAPCTAACIGVADACADTRTERFVRTHLGGVRLSGSLAECTTCLVVACQGATRRGGGLLDGPM